MQLSNDSSSFFVDYFYKDTLLLKTKSESLNDIFHFKQIGEYKYSSKNKLEESLLKQTYIDVETNDTVANTLEINKHNNKELVIESKLFNFKKPEQNHKTKYQYDCNILMEIKEYDSKNSLISTTKYKYMFDKFDNWVKRESIENDTLKYIRTREIEYK